MTQVMAALLLAVALLTATTAPAEAAARPVTFTAADGVTIAADLYDAVSHPAPGVVLVHMQSRTRADWAGVAGDLQRLGITVLAIDLRGHGASAGSTTPLSAMVQDVRAAVTFLVERAGVRPDAIGIVGASLGANLALLAAAETPLVRVTAALSPSTDYRGLRVGADTMRKLGDRHVWLAASADDPLALRTIRDLTADGAGIRDQFISPQSGHGTTLLQADAEVARTLVDWLRQRLLF
ncbi:MAG: alpha/beta fold hydrolase [Acidobacteria bacterium]|nr:alpha/beta fold hydrolase [Acidobacteriota bacterium]